MLSNNYLGTHFWEKTEDEIMLLKIRQQLKDLSPYLKDNSRFSALPQSQREHIVGLMEQENKLAKKIGLSLIRG